MNQSSLNFLFSSLLFSTFRGAVLACYLVRRLGARRKFQSAKRLRYAGSTTTPFFLLWAEEEEKKEPPNPGEKKAMTTTTTEQKLSSIYGSCSSFSFCRVSDEKLLVLLFVHNELCCFDDGVVALLHTFSSLFKYFNQYNQLVTSR